MAAEMPNTEIRPMDFGEILDHTIRVMKTGWKPLLLTGLLSGLPLVIYSGLMFSLIPRSGQLNSPTSNLFLRAVMGATLSDYTNLLELGGVLAGLLLLAGLLSPWLKGALIVIASRLYLGLPVTMGMALRMAGRRYFALVGTSLLILLFGLLAVPALIVGGLVFLAGLTVPGGLVALCVYWAFNRHALLIEGAGGGMPAIRRSFGLVSGRFWPLLGMSIVFYLFAAALNGQLAFVSQVPAQLLMSIWDNPLMPWVVALCSGLLTAVAAPLYVVGLTLVYYDVRMRKEGLDLELMAARQEAR